MYLPAAVQWRARSAVYKCIAGFFPRAICPRQKEFAQVPLEACAHCSRYGCQPEIEKKLCLRRAETHAAEEARSGDSRNERSPQQKKSVAQVPQRKNKIFCYFMPIALCAPAL